MPKCFLIQCCCSTAKSLGPHKLQQVRLPWPLLSPTLGSDSCPLGWWCCLTMLSSASFSLSHVGKDFFPVSQLFASGNQSIGASASASILPKNIQGWFPLGLTGLISLQYKRLSRVFSNTTVQKHQFFSTQPSLWSNSHIHTWLLDKP